MKRYRYAIFPFIAFVALILAGPAFAQKTKPSALPKTFYKRMEGTINGKFAITANLTQLDSEFFGNYYYDSKKIPIEFSEDSHVQPSGKVLLEESYYDPKIGEWFNTGVFEGSFVSGNTIKGRWTDSKTGAKYDFELHEKYPDGFLGSEMAGESKSWGDCGEEPCVELSYAYPKLLFPGYDPNANHLNDALRRSALIGVSKILRYDSLRNYQNLEEILLDVANSYKEETSNYPQEEVSHWACSSFVKIDYVFGDLASFDSYIYQYSGGAHGLESHLLSTVDLRTKEKITIQDALKPGYEKKLLELGQKILRKNFGLGPKDKLSKVGFTFEDDKFFLPENYYFQPNGIKFKYAEYEAAPYSMGSPEIVVPYADMPDLILPEGPLAGVR